MGLDEDSKVSFSCGAFEKFDLSGFVKSYNTVEQEDLSGANTNTGKPLVLAFSATEVRDWQDMYFPVQTANGFHGDNYSDIGFHFAPDARIFLDLSKRQNPPNLPSCASTAGNYWQGIYFDKFDVRLPNFFKMTNGGAVPLGKGSNLFIDNNGLIGDMVADKVFAMSEGYAESGQQDYPISLDKITANFTCGGKVNARMSGSIQLPTCGTLIENPVLIGYTFTFAENVGYGYLLNNGESNKSMGSNVVRLSTGSTLTFAVNNGNFNITETYPVTPTITSDAYENRICEGLATKLTINNCSNNIEWENGDATAEVTRSPIATAAYTVRCFDKYCIGATSAPITITVYENLAAPTLTASTTDATFCANRSESVTASDNCVGQIEWLTPESADWEILGDPASPGDRTTGIYYPNLTNQEDKTYKVRCRLNDCTSDISEATFTIMPAPASISLAKSPSGDVSCTTVTLTPSSCDGTIYWFRPNGIEYVDIRNHTQWSLSSDGIEPFYVKCKNESSGCFSDASQTQTVNVNKCSCKPAIPSLTKSPDGQISKSTVTLTATGCDNGTVYWYRPDGNEHTEIRGAKNWSRSDTGSDAFYVKCEKDGCFSDASTIQNVEVDACFGGIPAPTLAVSKTGSQCEGVYVDIIITGCESGSPTLYNETTGGVMSTGAFQWGRSQIENANYYAVCIDGNGCTSGRSNSVNINIIKCDDNPTICSDFTWRASSVSGCSINVGTNYSGGVKIKDSYTNTWHTSNNYTVSVNSNGTYYFDYELDNGCTGNGSVNVTTCTSTPPDDCAGKSTTAEWVKQGIYKCIDNVSYEIEKDVNICSSTFNSTRTIVQGGNACTCTPPSAPIIAGTTTIDLGQSVTLTASGCSGTVTWSGGSATVSPSTTTNYTATCSVGNCTSESSNVVTVTVTQPSPPDPGCAPPDAPTITVTKIECDGFVTLKVPIVSGFNVSWERGWWNWLGWHIESTSAGLNSDGHNSWRINGGHVNSTIVAKYTSINCGNSESSRKNGADILNGKSPNPPTMTGKTEKCNDGTAVEISARCIDGKTHWVDDNNADWKRNVNPTNTTTYKAYCQSDDCKSVQSQITVTITEPEPPTPIVGSKNFCSTGTVELTTSCTNGDVVWDGGLVSNKNTVTVGGTYSARCRINSSCYSDKVEHTVTNSRPMTFANNICTLNVANCQNSTIIWSYNGSQISSGNSSLDMRTRPTGYYSVGCTNNCGSFQESFEFNGIPADKPPCTQ